MCKYPATWEANHLLVLWKFACFHEDPGGTHLAEIYGINPHPPACFWSFIVFTGEAWLYL